ncbi:MAG: sugar nucleotide-binding protein, partial [Candidatus Omnitrophota bacterium]
VVRTSWLFGRNGKNFVNTIIEKSRTEKKLRIVNDQVGSPTYAKDLARALERLIGTVGVPGKEMFHVSNSGQCSWFDFAREILSDVKETAGVKVEPVTSSELARPAPRPGFSVLDNSKFQKTTEYEMRSWEDALKEYVDNECL